MASFYFKLLLLGLYSVPSLDRHFSQSHTALSRRGARGLVCRSDTPEYLLSDYYGHRCGGSRWLDQERRIFSCLFMSRVSLCWRTSYVQETRAIPYKSSTQGGSKNHEQHPCLLSLKMLLVSTTLILDQFSQTDFSRRASPPCQGSW